MDPMAGLSSSGNQNSSTAGEGRQIFNSQIAAKNSAALSDGRIYMSIMSGCFAGVAGVTGLMGLFAFLLLHALTGLALLLFTLRGDVKSYTGMNTTFGFLMMDIQKCSMSFILFWTLFYGLVYLF